MKKFKNFYLFIFWIVGCCTLSAAQAGQNVAVAGHITFSHGQVKVQNAQGNAPTELHQLHTGQAVHVGDRIQTGADSHVHIRMVDNAFVSLRPQSQLTIESYDYDPDQPAQSRIRMDLQYGSSRAVTGKGGQAAKHNYRFNTPLAAIGIRGTDFIVSADHERTRATVEQGTVVVSPLEGNCMSQQLGPCQGQWARELSASTPHAFLEVNRQRQMPTIELPRGSDASKDAPKDPSKEDLSKTPNLLESNADSKVNREVATQAATRAQQTDQLNVQVVPTDPAANGPNSLAQWGRWSTLVQQHPAGSPSINQAFARIEGPYIAVARNETHALAIPESASSIFDGTGQIQLSLRAAEAYTVQNGTFTPAPVLNNGTLLLDLGANRFSTALQIVTRPGEITALQANGSLNRYGQLNASEADGTRIQGIAFQQGQQAAYLFDKPLGGGTSVSGAAQWAKP